MAFNLKNPPSLLPRHEAYPYQLDAVRAVQSLPYSAIFHEQGLGKTKIAIDLLLIWLSEDVVDTVFIATKKTLVQNWVDEFAAHSHITPRVLSGNRRDNSIALNSPVLVYVMNYEVVATNLDLMREFLATCRVAAILDESQKIKNPESKLAKSFHALADGFARRVIMTGTPVANRPYDIWSQVKFLDNGETFGESFSEFKDSLDIPSCAAESAGYGEVLSGVMRKIKSFSVRDTKETAGLELPDKTILTHSVSLAPKQAEIYASYRDNMAYEFKEGDASNYDDAEYILKRLLRLVQCASNPRMVDGNYTEIPGKFTKLLGLLGEIDMQAHKVIIWTGFVQNIDWLHSHLSRYMPQKVQGEMPVFARNNALRKFKKEDRCRILLATPGAAKEGLTLTVANHAIFYDRGFSLDDYLQAQDRIHRISQNEECFVHNLMATNTIDEWVDVLLNAKHQAARLTQGDISRDTFETNFQCGLSSTLAQILLPARSSEEKRHER